MKDPLSLVEVACDGERKHLVTFVIRAEEIRQARSTFSCGKLTFQGAVFLKPRGHIP